MKYEGEVVQSNKEKPQQKVDVGLPTQALTSFARGATFGNFDELMGRLAQTPMAMSYLGDTGMTPEQTGQYTTDFTRQVQNQFAQEHPVADFGLRMAGSMVPLTALPMSRSFQTAPLKTGAITSGLIGGLTATGEADRNKAEAALVGATLGIPLGLITTLGTQLLMQKGLPAMARLSEITRSGKDKAMDIVRPYFQAGNQNVSTALSRARQLGPKATIPDIGGKPTQALAGEFTSQDMSFLHRLDKIFGKRAREAATRLNSSITRTLGIKGKDFAETARNISNARKLEAGPLYEQASQETVKIPTLKNYVGSLDDLISKTESTGFDRALKSFRRSLFRTDNTGRRFLKQDVESLIYSRKALGDAASKAFRNGEKDKWLLLKQARDQFDEQVMPQAYKEANSIWSSSTQLNDAMDAGRRFLTSDADFIREGFNSMSQAEKEHYLIGAVRAINDKMNNVQEGGKVTTYLNKPAIKEKLGIIFPDKQSLGQFMRDIERENVFTAAKNFVFGNSMTHFRQQASKIFDTIQTDIPGSKMGLVSTIIDRLKLDHSMDPKVNEELQNLLTTQGPSKEVIERLMETPFRSQLPEIIKGFAPHVGAPVSLGTGVATGELGQTLAQ